MATRWQRSRVALAFGGFAALVFPIALGDHDPPWQTGLFFNT
jgi:hypothetical protein